MRASGVCPKCQGRQFWRIETAKQRGGFVGGLAPLPVGGETRDSIALTEVYPVGSFELYVCKGCGLTEWYAKDIGALKDDRLAGVTSIDRTPRSEGPYR